VLRWWTSDACRRPSPPLTCKDGGSLWQIWNKATGRVPVVVIHRGRGVSKRALLPDGTTELIPIGELEPMTKEGLGVSPEPDQFIRVILDW